VTAPVEVPLGDTTSTSGRWVSGGRPVRAMRNGDFDAWAETALADGDYQTWVDVDPTITECEAFFTAWGEATGQDSGKSGGSRRSSKSTARR
jgi:hypothetical protein